MRFGLVGPSGRTTMGCSTPTSRMEATSSARSSASNSVRGCLALGTMSTADETGELCARYRDQVSGSDSPRFGVGEEDIDRSR